jgi:hypothetical protein
VFPRAAQIGRDSPQIAQYTGNNAAARGADRRLAPRGRPLGPQSDVISRRRRPDRGRSTVANEQQAKAAKAAPEIATATESAQPVQKPVPKPASVQVTQKPVTQPATQIVKPKVEVAVQTPPARVASIVTPTQVKPAPATAKPIADSAFDLAQVASESSANAAPSATKPAEKPAVAAPSPSVADAFADFSAAPTAASKPKAGGVDITKIKPPREVAKKPEVKPKEPVHPRRFWVQIATGKDRKALKFDWRRLGRKAPKTLGDFSPHVTPWGQSNRLLAGPFSSAKNARNAVNSLKESGVDSFTFTSPEGQEVDKL